jgi:DNA transposase THAP9
MGFKFGNKLGLKHIFFKRNAMKVSIACETMSESTASAMEYLVEQGAVAMQGSGETVKFIRAINLLFDILNSQSKFAEGDKAVLTPKNIAQKKDKCVEVVRYLFTLKIGGVPLSQHKRRTFLIGFAGAVKSVFNVTDYIFRQFPIYTSISTFQFSQDFLEVFFGIIRSRLGCNTNPTVLEFK